MKNLSFKLNKSNIIQFTASISTLIINVASYAFLPNKVGIQINSSGVSNSAPKLLYLCISFAVISLFSYLGTRPLGSKKDQYTVGAVILAILNIFTIILNLIFL